ncbi:hypothetical protein ACHAXS_005488 [Conticribra weissflogii]
MGDSYKEHLCILKIILGLLAAAGLQVNPQKSEWCKKEIAYLGFTITPTGYKPMQSRVNAILGMTAPKTIRQLREFIGCINFIKNHIPKCAELMQPLTKLTKKGISFKWTEEQQQAFQKIKAAVSEAVMLVYPDVAKPFVLYTDASDYAISGILTQDNQTISCFSKKLSGPQLKYTVTDKELLAVYESLKFNHNIIYGCEVTVMTDNKNLTHGTTNHSNQRVLRQRLAIDQEYHAKLVYYEGESNTGADGLSRLPFNKAETKESRETVFATEASSRINNPLFPLDLSKISEAQKSDEQLLQVKEKTSQTDKFSEITMESYTLTTFNGKIWVPQKLQKHLLVWYHKTLQHAGATRLIKTISIHFGFPGSRNAVEKLVRTCDTCQRNKIIGKKAYGKIPLTPALRDKEPWQVVHIDCTGPWDILYKSDITNKTITYKLNLLTITDACLGWTEFAVTKNKTAQHTAHLFNINWLCQYPCPQKVVYDNGSKFIGFKFQEMLESYGIQPVPTTVKNPQANSTIERLHLTLGDQLRCTTFEGSNFLEDVDTIVQACAYAARTTVPSNSSYSPAQLTFGRDMIFRQQIIVDWEKMKQQRLQQAAANNDKENKKRVEHTYSVNDLVLIVTPSSERNKQRKLSSPTEGPYRITKVYANGTVRILRGHFEETTSIRRLRPYHKTE